MKAVRSNVEERASGLGRCALFSRLEPAELRSLAAPASLRAFEAGEVIFGQGMPAEGFHVIVEGQVKVCRFGADGREQILHVFGGGEPCGEVAMFQGGDYPAAAFAIAGVRTIYLPRDRFIELCRARPGIMLGMLAVLSVRLRHFVQLVDDLSLKDVSARLAKYLLDRSARAGGSALVELDTTKAVLASRLGTIAETLSRTLAKMQRRGAIRVRGRKIALTDPAGLQALAAGLKL